MSAKFITLEGLDGAGKSTHLASIVQCLQTLGHEVIMTREPGGTPLGEKLRVLLLNEAMHAETELLLMFAARREHLDKVIMPALARGITVVSDRFTDSSYAYQGGGRGVDASTISGLAHLVHGYLEPDLTLLFDISSVLSVTRAETLVQAGERLDKFEQEDCAFMARVRDAYLARAQAAPQRFRIIDASLPLDQVQQTVKNIITSL